MYVNLQFLCVYLFVCFYHTQTADSVQQLDNADTQGIHFTMPDDDDFNPDTMLPELTKLTQDLDDSLCFDEGEETQLPFDELDIGVPSVSELHEDNSTTHTEPNKGSGEELNDSLCGDDEHEETQYQTDTANDIQPAVQNIPTPNLDDSMEMIDNDDTLQATTHTPEGSKLPLSQTEVLSTNNGASDDDPNLDELFPETIHDPQYCSGEGSKTGETEGDSSKTEGGSNKSEGCSDKCEKSSSPIQQSTKVVPSFGTKKKGFMPPTVKAPDPPSSSSSATATAAKPAPKSKESSFTSKTKEQNCEGAKLAESSASKTQKNQKKESCSGANKENSPSQDDAQEPNFSAPKLADTSDTTTDKKVATAEVPANTATAKKTKATVKKPPQGKKDNDAKKQEKENKKLEKEQKKLEQEQRKAEKERLKEEKRLEQERKKAEREQKKMEKDLKKLEREQKKAQKQQKPPKKKIPEKDGGAQASSNSEAQHNGSCEQETAEKVSETSLMAESDKTGDKASAVSNCCGTSASESTDDSNKLQDTDSTSPPEATSTASTDAPETMPPPTCNPNAPEGTATEASSSENVVDNCDKEMPETMKPRETKLSSPGETSADNPGDSVVTKELDVSATTDSFNCNEVSGKQPSEKSNNVMLQDTSGSAKDDTNTPKEMVATKDPQKQQASSKVKKNQANKSARQQDSASSQTQNKKKTKSAKTQNDKKVSSSAGSRKRKATTTGFTSESEIEPPEPKKPRSKPSNYYGPVWVQCEKPDCQKWRQLKDCLDPSEIPERWTCSMNTGVYVSCGYLHPVD